MKALNRIILSAFLCLTGSCTFKNDMAYPRVFAEVLEFKVEGEAKPTVIDRRNLTVNVEIDELSDLKAVPLVSYKWTDGAVSTELPEVLDLSEPIELELTNYHTYHWKIVGRQPVDRYIDCDGLSEITWIPEKDSAVVTVLKTADIRNLNIKRMKLGLEGSEVVSTKGKVVENGEIVEKEQKCEFPMTLDCFYEREFTVRYKGENTIWKVKFEHNHAEPKVNRVSPWCRHALVYAEYDGVGEVKIQYRKKTESGQDGLPEESGEPWTDVEGLTVEGVKISRDITGLEEDTDYEVRVVQDELPGKSVAFRTYKAEQLPNMGFNEWSKSGKVWNPYTSSTGRAWDTANAGVALLGNSTTSPDYDRKVEGEASARMVTTSAFGFLAAGNIFTGQFDHLQLTTAYLYWGIPYTSRPATLKGFYDYAPCEITAPKTLAAAGGMANPYAHLDGQMDSFQIMVALVAEGENDHGEKGAFLVVSNKPGSPDLKTDPRVIGFGEIVNSENTGGKFREFELDIKYKDGDDRVPAYIIVIGCSSAYGNFFTGGLGSVLYIDDFKFEFE